MRSRTLRRTATTIALATAFGSARVAAAAPGPGIGNLDCGQAEYYEPFAFFENSSGPNGTNVALMIRGYFLTLYAPDSGKPPGEIGIYDVSNPKAPNEVRHIENSDTNQFREAHSLPVGLINGKQYIAFQTIKGIQFWDFTDPLDAKRIGSIDLPGVNGGDYEDVAWQASWQGRYLYVAGGNRGIYIVDAADPTNPKLLNQVSISSTGGFRVGPIFALGDYLVISNMDQGGAYAVLDISRPSQPALLAKRDQLPRIYAITVGGGDRIYAAGRDGNFLIHSFSDPTKITEVKNALIGQDQLYAAAQDRHVFLGRQNNFVKVDITNETNPTVVGEGTLNRDHPDHGQVTPIGNLVYIGNDHGTGSAFFCHQYGRDTTPLVMQTAYPKDGSTGVPTTARVSLLFSDHVNIDTITPANLTIRRAGGETLSGIFTYAFNTVSFSPDSELEEDTTYEIVLAAGGLEDAMGNALPEEVVVRFSTGDAIVVPPPGTGGSSGDGGSSGSGFGGSSGSGFGGSSGSGFGGSAGQGVVGGTGPGGSGFGGTGVGGTSSSAGTGPGSSGSGSGSSSADPDATDPGCSCAVSGRGSVSGSALLALGALIGVRRRRSRRV